MTQLKMIDHAEEIIALANGGMTIGAIAKRYGCYHQAVANLLKRFDYTSPRVLQCRKMQYFNVIDTHTKAYLLGFIAADGAIVNATPHCKSLTISIHKRDRIVLDCLRSELDCDHAIKGIANDQVRLVISHRDLIESIEKHGITVRKSLTMPNILDNIPKEFRNSFILGYFDGDGSISVREVVCQGRYSRKQSIQIRLTKAMAIGIVEELKIKQYHFHEKDNIGSLIISSIEEIENFFKQCYSASPIYLSRKRDRFLIALYRNLCKTEKEQLVQKSIEQDRTISLSYD